MKDVMDTHRWRELNLERDWGDLFEERERAKVSRLEGGGGVRGVIGGSDVFGAEKDEITFFVGVWPSTRVGVLGLADLGLKETVACSSEGSLLRRHEGVEIGGRGGAGAEQGRRYSRVETMIEKKGRDASGRMNRVVVCKLSGGQVEIPVILFVVDKSAQHSLEGLDCTFGLAIGLRVER